MKTFTFQYDPSISFTQMAMDLEKAVKTGKPSVHPNRIRVADIETLWLSPATLKLFSCIVDSQPSSVHHLAQLLQKNCPEIEKDIASLEALGIIKLEKVGKKVKPISLYDRIIFDFSLAKVKSSANSFSFRKLNKS